MPAKTFHLFFTEDDRDKTTSGRSFVISEELKDSEEDWFIRLADLDVEQGTTVSYDAFWPHLVLSHLLTSLQLYTQLDKQFEKETPSKIVTHNIREEYKRVADDLGDEYDITVQHRQRESIYKRFLSHFVLKSAIIILLIDELYSIIRLSISPSKSKLKNSSLFIPFPDRFESTHPIIEEVDGEYNILVTPYALSWGLRGHDYERESDAIPISEYASPKIVWKQIALLINLQFDIWFKKVNISTNIDQELKSKYDVGAPRTVEYICRRTATRDIRLILSRSLIERAIQDLNPSDVVVGAMNPRDRIALLAATGVEADTHYIPHSIAYANEFVPPTKDTNHYVVAPADETVLRERYPEEMLPEIKPFGRPYLDTLAEQSASKALGSSSRQIVLATQPYDDWIRDNFVRDNLAVLDRIGYSEKVIIKIHPSEEKEHYTNSICGQEYEFEVSVEEGSMSEYISGGETVITVNSNVGIESILLGAYCVSYNPFEPFTWPSSYIDGENVPYETTQEGLEKHIKETVNRSTKPETQREYIYHAYSIGNSAEAIGDSIDNKDTL